MEDLLIYLSGSIRKGTTDSRQSFWTDDDVETLKAILIPRRIILLNPAVRTDDLTDLESTFGRDAFQVFSSDLVIVDARDRRGIGVGVEMVYAKLNNKPVVAVAPPHSHYNRENFTFMDQHLDRWIHPFILALSDKIVPSVVAAGEWIRDDFLSGNISPKGIECFDAAMRYYINTQLDRDSTMSDLVFSHERVRERISGRIRIDRNVMSRTASD